MKGSATDWGGTHAVSWSNAELLRDWRILPSAGELAVRRVRWLQSMVQRTYAHVQTVSVLLGHILHEPPALASSGALSSTANPWLRQFARDLDWYRGISGTETFFE
eukprot:3647139-Pyramimonas_sp.AAC.1